jgi:DNA-binding Xre family transcriptional regulator
MTPEQIQRALQDRNLAELARRIDVAYGTLYRMKNGRGAKAQWTVVEKISRYLEGCNE